jgi:multidrug efflux pump subunit AcrA (membrane-fusion protein)
MPVRRVALVLAFCAIVGVGYWRADLLNFLSRAGIVFASPGAATPGKVSESSSQQNNPAKAAPPVFVKTAIASVGSLHIQRQAIGWLVSPASVNLTSPQQGTIVELVAKEGANLRRGDLIAKLDDRSSQSAVAKDRAQLTRDQALLTQAELNLSRAQILFSKGMGAQQARDDAKAAQQTAAATIDIDNAALATDLVNVSNAESARRLMGVLAHSKSLSVTWSYLAGLLSRSRKCRPCKSNSRSQRPIFRLFDRPSRMGGLPSRLAPRLLPPI